MKKVPAYLSNLSAPVFPLKRMKNDEEEELMPFNKLPTMNELKSQFNTKSTKETVRTPIFKDPTAKVIFENSHTRVEEELVKTAGQFNKETIDILGWNINGIRAISKKKFLPELINKRNPDIVCFYELKCGKEKYEDEEIWRKVDFMKQYYYRYYSFSQIGGYAGVAVYSKLKPLSYSFRMDKEILDNESRFIMLEFNSFFLVSVYVPTSGENLKRMDYRAEQWDPHFREYVTKLRQTKPVLIVGDMNVAHQDIDIHDPRGRETRPSFTPQERNNFSKLLECGFVDVFRHFNPEAKKYTFWNYRGYARNGNKGWRVDYMLSDKEFLDNVVKSDILTQVMGSDHCPFTMQIKNTELERKVDESTQESEEKKEKQTEESKNEEELSEKEKSKNEAINKLKSEPNNESS